MLGQAARLARLGLAGALGVASGAGALAWGYTAYMAPPPAPAPVAAPVPRATVYSAGRPMPMPADEPEPRVRVRASPGRQASAMRSPDGHFYFDAFVNGTRIRTMFDTGASLVSLTAEDAVRAGVNVGSLDYDVPTSTANGQAMKAYVVLASVRVGDITKNNVPALVSRPGAGNVTLLGQAFISRVTSYRHERSELILTDE